MSQPSRTQTPAASGIADLMQQFADRWLIRYEATLGVWSAERRTDEGRHIRFIAAHNPATLAGKIASAEVAEP